MIKFTSERGNSYITRTKGTKTNLNTWSDCQPCLQGSIMVTNNRVVFGFLFVFFLPDSQVPLCNLFNHWWLWELTVKASYTIFSQNTNLLCLCLLPEGGSTLLLIGSTKFYGKKALFKELIATNSPCGSSVSKWDCMLLSSFVVFL